MVVIFVTQECNLNCGYCYVEKKNGVIDLITIDRFLNLLKKTGYFEVNPAEILIMGGEPLLYPKRVIEIIDKFEEIKKGSKYMVATNLTIADGRLFRDDRIIFSVSIDGTKETHDKSRNFGGNIGSYDLIMKNLVKLAKFKKEIRIVYTFDPDNNKNDFARHVDSILNYPGLSHVKFKFGIRPIALSINANHEEKVKKSFFPLLDYTINAFRKGKILDISIFNNAITPFVLTNAGCPLGYDAFTIFPDGDLWPCTSYYMLKNRKIGNTFDNKEEELLNCIMKLRMANHAIKKIAKEKVCDCILNNDCNKYLCMAEFEMEKYNCHASSYIYNAKIIYNLLQYLESKLTPEEISEIRGKIGENKDKAESHI